MLKAAKDQMISMQVWRIPRERISDNALCERPDEAMGVYTKDNCSIQTNLIEISDKTNHKLVLPEIVYNLKKKLGCIFVENHNPESVLLKRGQTIGLVTSCIVTQEEHGQAPVERSDATQSVTGKSNAKDRLIGGASEGDDEKAYRHHTVYRK